MNKTGQKISWHIIFKMQLMLGRLWTWTTHHVFLFMIQKYVTFFLPCLMSELGMRFEPAPMWICPPCLWRSRSLALWRLSWREASLAAVSWDLSVQREKTISFKGVFPAQRIGRFWFCFCRALPRSISCSASNKACFLSWSVWKVWKTHNSYKRTRGMLKEIEIQLLNLLKVMRLDRPG